MTDEDNELNAIKVIIDALTPLADEERNRVIDYVLQRLQMPAIGSGTPSFNLSLEKASNTIPIKLSVNDIRTLTAQKQPRSANEMVALVAYYLSELASDGEHSDTVNLDTIKRYFKMAGFPLPSVLKNVLPNAAQAGYLENVNWGEYKLNPVGYNLVVHGLPRSGSPGPSSQSTRPRKPRTRKSARRGK